MRSANVNGHIDVKREFVAKAAIFAVGLMGGVAWGLAAIPRAKEAANGFFYVLESVECCSYQFIHEKVPGGAYLNSVLDSENTYKELCDSYQQMMEAHVGIIITTCVLSLIFGMVLSKLCDHKKLVSVGIFGRGFCWGTYMGTHKAMDPLVPKIK